MLLSCSLCVPLDMHLCCSRLSHTHRPQALIHLLPALSTNDAISVFIVLLIHKIHFSNQITVLRPNSITGSLFLFFFFFAEAKTKTNKNKLHLLMSTSIFNISTTEEAESLWCSSSSVVMVSLGTVKHARGIGYYSINKREIEGKIRK